MSEVNVFTRNKTEITPKKLRMEIQHEKDRVKGNFRTVTIPDDLTLLPDDERLQLYETLAIRVARYLDGVDT